MLGISYKHSSTDYIESHSPAVCFHGDRSDDAEIKWKRACMSDKGPAYVTHLDAELSHDPQSQRSHDSSTHSMRRPSRTSVTGPSQNSPNRCDIKNTSGVCLCKYSHANMSFLSLQFKTWGGQKVWTFIILLALLKSIKPVYYVT